MRGYVLVALLLTVACGNGQAPSSPTPTAFPSPSPTATRVPTVTPTPTPSFDVTAKTDPSDDFYVYPAAVVEEIAIEEGLVQQGTLRVGEFHYAAHNSRGRSFISKYNLNWDLVAQLELSPQTHSPLFGEPDLEHDVPHLGSSSLNPADGRIYFTVTEANALKDPDAIKRNGLLELNPETFEIVESIRLPAFVYVDGIEFSQVRGLTYVWLPSGGVVSRLTWVPIRGRPKDGSFTRYYLDDPWSFAQTVRIRGGKLYLVTENGTTPDAYEGIAVFNLNELVASPSSAKVLNQAEYYYRIPLPVAEPDNEGLELAFEEGPYAYATSAHGDTVWKLRLEGE